MIDRVRTRVYDLKKEEWVSNSMESVEETIYAFRGNVIKPDELILTESSPQVNSSLFKREWISNINIPPNRIMSVSLPPNTTLATFDSKHNAIIFEQENSHPWINDLRITAQMLEGQIEIPHLNTSKLSGNSRQRRKIRRRISRGESQYTSYCMTCVEAAKARRRYQRNKNKFF